MMMLQFSKINELKILNRAVSQKIAVLRPHSTCYILPFAKN